MGSPKALLPTPDGRPFVTRIVETLHDHWRIVLGFAGLSVFNAVGFYVSFVYS